MSGLYAKALGQSLTAFWSLCHTDMKGAALPGQIIFMMRLGKDCVISRRLCKPEPASASCGADLYEFRDIQAA